MSDKDANRDYLSVNRELWNARVPHHIASSFYDVPGFLEGKSSLNTIELELLGDVKGKRILHLQCHFGQDSISLARMGAHVTGVDLSDAALAEARSLAQRAGVDVRFIESDVYALPQVLNEKFDVVFTSYGTIGWLPDLNRWAEVVKTFLQPGGQFLLVEFHPTMWMMDNAFEKLTYSYFNVAPIIETETGTYAETGASVNKTAITWNHPISDVLTPLLARGLQLTHFQEFDYSPYNIFPDANEVAPGRFAIRGKEGLLPLVYAVRMLSTNTAD
jgi:2-polyprenyl-3-methyl-5-hydroxy-6-metoxy-1,4-benzoquinol methylase